ncbi:hypothetical protein OK074_8643 [Actinobacteria bacterium OK074]|nr:hypothetical protein OK074_8643 [Actinobacteria bacterium OK074]
MRPAAPALLQPLRLPHTEHPTPPHRAPHRDLFRGFWHRHRTPLAATLPFVPLYALWAWFLATGGGDLAAQDAWAAFASRYGDSAYNLFWYGGTHTANYSVISPYLMAAFGVRTVTVASGVAASWLTAVLLVRTGVRRPLGPALLASFALWCDVASGRTTFALGTVFGLAALVVLTPNEPDNPYKRHTSAAYAAVCAALATLSSPVAGLFVAVVGAGFLLVRDRVRAGALLLPPAVVVGATSLLFPFSGEQLMPAGRIPQPALLGLAVTVLAPRAWRVARVSGAVYAAGTVVVYLVPSPIGTNIERLAALFAPAVLLAALLGTPQAARVRRGLLACALALSVLWVGSKTVADLKVITPVPTWATDSRGVVRALERLGADRTRVEAVPAQNHREAVVLTPYVNLARGWNRQLDMERARLFYDGTFSAATYRAWLDHWAVGFVVLPDGRADSYALAEDDLVRHHRPGWLEPVWHDANWQVFRVRDAVPLVSPPASAVRTTGAEMDVRLPRPGAVTVRIAYSPWLHVSGGCLSEAPDGEFTRLTVSAPGVYRISSEYGPSPAPASC